MSEPTLTDRQQTVALMAAILRAGHFSCDGGCEKAEWYVAAAMDLLDRVCEAVPISSAKE
jgi:hypothetical protein